MTMQAVAKHNTHPSTWQNSGSSFFLHLSIYLFEPLLPAIFALFFSSLSFPVTSPSSVLSQKIFVVLFFLFFDKDSAWHVNLKALKTREREIHLFTSTEELHCGGEEYSSIK